MNIDYEIFLTRNVREFYHLQRFLAWESKCQGEYQKLISAKHSSK